MIMSSVLDILKNNPELRSRNRETINLKRLKKVPVKPKETCVKRFNAIVDYVLQAINRIEQNCAPLWSTQTDRKPHSMGDWGAGDSGYNIWTYYFRSGEEYHTGGNDWYNNALVNSEHSNAYAVNEEDACYHLKNLATATVQKKKVKEHFDFGEDASGLDDGYGIFLSTYHMDKRGPLEKIGKPRSGAIQLETLVVDPNNSEYLDSWSEDDRAEYIPAIVRVLKEHDEVYKTVIQMAKDAVNDLKL